MDNFEEEIWRIENFSKQATHKIADCSQMESNFELFSPSHRVIDRLSLMQTEAKTNSFKLSI